MIRNDSEKLYFCGDDLMGRGKYAQNIVKMICKCHTFPKSNDNESYVIGIDAPWGSGKTYFVKMLKNYLEGNWVKPNMDTAQINFAEKNTNATCPPAHTSVNVIYYDAWKNDFWDNSFEPLFDSLIQSSYIKNAVEKKDIIDLAKSAAKIITLGIKGFVYKKIEDQIETSALDEIFTEMKDYGNNMMSRDYQTQELFPEYTAFRCAMSSLRNYLNKTIRENGKLVIIIDELDRCKPTFAVQTLEIVKHLFNIEGLVFIFSLDINQLSQSVKVVYGENFDAVGYLERFFNYLTLLPRGNFHSTMEHYFKEFNINVAHTNVIKSFETIAIQYQLSLRDLRTILSSYFVLQETILECFKTIPNAQILYFYFLTLKYKNPTYLADAVFTTDMTEFKEFLNKFPIPFINIDNEQYLSFVDSFGSETIEKMKFAVIKNGKIENSIPKKMRRYLDDNIILENGINIRINSSTNLSLLLYPADLINFENIKIYRPIEYIYRQLEMCDFCT